MINPFSFHLLWWFRVLLFNQNIFYVNEHNNTQFFFVETDRLNLYLFRFIKFPRQCIINVIKKTTFCLQKRIKTHFVFLKMHTKSQAPVKV